MLYVFHVDAGQMTTYDMKLTLESVKNLKAAIERKTKIPSNSIVLLVSGGEVLVAENMVSSYSAGTDTNPIYMFTKPSVKESLIKQSVCGDLSPIVELSTGEFRSDIRSMDGKSVEELSAAVKKCCSMGHTVNTVVACANLAQQFSELARDVSRTCDQLVHEQHLQHQGWAAVVANLEDIFNEFCERSRNFKESFKKHRLKKDEYLEKLHSLHEVLESLGKIPILSALKVNAEEHRFSAFDVFEDTEFEGMHYRVEQPMEGSGKSAQQDFGVEVFKLSEEDVFPQPESSKDSAVALSSEAMKQIDESDEGVVFTAPSHETRDEHTLLQWILAQGNKASLQDIVDYCTKGLAMIDAEPLKEREAELYHILEYANMHGLKQIKGIENRLSELNKMLSEAKKLERDQHDQAASLIQCRDRLNSSCDPSVLPTLVQSHWCQLEKLLKGHQSLIDYRRRIARSKDELSHILEARLGTVLTIENSMSVQDAHAMMTYQCFNRLSRYFGIVSQLHCAPGVFVHAVREVARRRQFSQAHLEWATELSSKLLKIHEEEMSRRQEFSAIFEGHFLKSLFPGMMDFPPTFAIQAPPAFDSKLPKITDEDVQLIVTSFPELAKDIPVYDMEPTVRFFRQRVGLPPHEGVDAQVDTERDFESETDTGFEKLGQIVKVDMSTTCAPDTMAVSLVTEDNMDTYKQQIERLHEFLVKISGLCRISAILIKEELTKLKTDLLEQKKFMTTKYLEVLEAWKKSNDETDLRFREQTQRLTVDHELELSDMKATLNGKDEEIDMLKKEKEALGEEHKRNVEKLEKEHQSTKDLLEKTREEIGGFQKRLGELDVVKQKEIKDLQEKMHLEYKAEIESLRSRFRLVAMTNMDRSPSESSLEQIERTDVIEISSHNAIVMQTKENAEVEKEEAVKQAIEKTESEWKQKFEAEIAALKAKYEVDKQVTINDVTRRLLTEKDRQLETLREREQILTRECTKYRETIQQLTDPETNDYDTLLKTQFATLENEKAVLKQQVAELKKELEKKADESEKSREDDSVSDGRTSPKKEAESRRARTRCHTPLGLAAGALSLSSCLPGHAVLVLWDRAHTNYTVLQESSIMYFVHSDCLPPLDLSIQVKNESERKLYAIATVESKEYCYAKKSGNRYQMPRASRFYRVRVKPMVPALPTPVCCDHKHRHDISKSADPAQASSSTADEASRTQEVATGTLINLDSPISEQSEQASQAGTSTDRLDSIEADQWHLARMQTSSVSAMTDMECSVGRCPGEPLELTASSVAVVNREIPVEETAEEAAP